MNNNYETLLIAIATIILGIAGRFLFMRLFQSSRPATRFRIIAGLFLLYTLVMLLMLWQIYLSMQHMNATIQDYHHSVIMVVCAINTVVFFIGILYYAIRGKHQLSGNDKMKLMDM